MSRDRYVVAGLAHVRSAWFRDVARWSTSGALPVEFVKSVSFEELRARLASGRAFSAVVVDGGLPGVDRDLLDLARARNIAVVVVDDARVERDWVGLGASATLGPTFSRAELLQALDATAVRIGRGDTVDLAGVDDGDDRAWHGELVAVTGGGGVGTSIAAMALAQGLADDPRYGGLVVLADLALHADQAMLHHVGDLVPGVQELTEAHRIGHPAAEEVRRLAFSVPDRGYHLLLGLRRHRDWTVIRPRSFHAGLDGLCRAFRIVVADVDRDLEGEAQCGSVDVEERNVMARTAVSRARAVIAVGAPGPKGLVDLVRTVSGLLEHGVSATRIVTVVNRAPRNPRVRAELTRGLGALTASLAGGSQLASPVFLAERRRFDELLRDAVRLPPAMTLVLANAVVAALERSSSEPLTSASAEPSLVTPGTLGAWSDYEGTGVA